MVRSKSAAVSARKLKANRRNARKSTGPKTAEGKARSSRNATGYGIFCQALVLPGEDRQMFDLLRTSLIHEHRPQNVTELFLVDRMASAMWRLRRIQAAEADAHEAAEVEMFEGAARARRKLAETMSERWPEDQDEDGLPDDVEEDEDERREKQAMHERLARHDDLPGRLPSSMTTCRLIGDGQGKLSTLEKLSLYEKRLEGTIHRCLRDLKKLRTPARGEVKPDRPSPFLQAENQEIEVEDPPLDVPTPLSPALSPGRGEGGQASAGAPAQVPQGQAVVTERTKVKNEPTAETNDEAQAIQPQRGEQAERAWEDGREGDISLTTGHIATAGLCGEVDRIH